MQYGLRTKLACVASVSLGLERVRGTGLRHFARANSGARDKKKKEGEEGTTCKQTPSF